MSMVPHARHAGTQLFGSFHLGDAELVLPVSVVQEVVNYPAAVIHVPLAPDFLLGLFNLRGRLVPMIHLGSLLGLTQQETQHDGKVAIVDFRGARVGLLFDATGEILRVRDEERVDFVDGEASMIDGALKLDGGNRILQRLNVDALHPLHGLPLPRAEAIAAEPARQRALLGQRRQSVSFRVQGARLALPMSAIHEIIRVPALSHSVLAGELCLGMINLRGSAVPVVDFARFLSFPAAEAGPFPAASFDDPRRIVVIRQSDMYFGLLVDEVESIVGYREDEVLAIPPFSADRPYLFTGCISHADASDIILLDPAALFSDDVVADLTQGHHALYQSAIDEAQPRGRRKAGARETYVTFRLDRLMGMRIDQLREIIDMPTALMAPPGAPGYVRGMLNLRRSLITIVDLRAVYDMASCPDASHAKVLVVEHEGEKFGLVVDAIETIVTIDVAEKIGVPSILGNQIAQPFRSDMREVVDLPGERALLLLDAVPLTRRLGGQAVH